MHHAPNNRKRGQVIATLPADALLAQADQALQGGGGDMPSRTLAFFPGLLFVISDSGVNSIENDKPGGLAGAASFHYSYVVPNAQIAANSMHATSVHLGLAADSVAQADYDMASVPLEHIPDTTTHPAPAMREGRSIGYGLFASRVIRPGEVVACFGEGAFMVLAEWPTYCASA
ncbi:hypothetical protein OAO87_01440 [bacterium]|nr:hypothetical protein [bacterium]